MGQQIQKQKQKTKKPLVHPDTRTPSGVPLPY